MLLVYSFLFILSLIILLNLITVSCDYDKSLFDRVITLRLGAIFEKSHASFIIMPASSTPCDGAIFVRDMGQNGPSD